MRLKKARTLVVGVWHSLTDTWKAKELKETIISRGQHSDGGVRYSWPENIEKITETDNSSSGANGDKTFLFHIKGGKRPLSITLTPGDRLVLTGLAGNDSFKQIMTDAPERTPRPRRALLAKAPA